VVSSSVFAQDTVEQKVIYVQDDVYPVSEYIQEELILAPEKIIVPELQESFLTRHLRQFGRRPGLLTLEEDIYYEPLGDEADSIFEMRLSQIDTELNLPYNPRVRAYIEVYTQRRRNQTRTMLMLSRYYFPIFERKLAEHGLPEELKYLAVVESALNPRAVSRVGASGLWQFMYRTGRAFGLTVNDELDERFDPEKATEAAVLYLQQLYNRFGCWTLALAAYNSGQGTVSRAITRARGRRDFWEIYNFLPQETRNFVPAFIGAMYAMKFHEEHGITVSETDLPEAMDTLMIHQRLHFDQIAKFTGAPIQTIRDHNPQYLRDIIPASETNPFVLRLPADFILRFIEYSDTIFANPFPPTLEFEEEVTDCIAENQQQEPSAVSRVTYRVRRGDALSLIAVRFGVTVAQLKAWNDLPSDLIRVNQHLTIYSSRTNLRDMTEVVAFQNAQRARAAELAAANQPPAPVTPPRQPTTTPQQQPIQQRQPQQQAQQPVNRPATTTAPTRPPVAAATTAPARPATTQTQTRPATNVASAPVRTAPTQSTLLVGTNQPAQRAQAHTPPPRTATGNVQQPSNVAVVQSRNVRAETSGTIVHHRVQRGETLFSIHRRYPGSNIQEIINMNGLRDNGNRIFPDQVLRIRIN